MKLNLSQLDQHVTGKLAAIYLISGDDPIQKQEAIQLLRKSAKQAGFTERTRLAPDSGLNEDQLYTALYSPSLTTDKSLLELDFRSKAPAKAVAEIIGHYAENSSSTLLVIIDTAKLDDTVTRTAWYKAVEKCGVVVAIWPIPREQLPQWITARAKKYKLQMQHDAASLLADYVEGNLTAAAQAVEKIYLLKPEKSVDAATVQSILADESRFTVFDLTDAMIGGDPARTLHILNTLREDGIEPVIVLWGVTRELRILADMLNQQQQGNPWDEIFKKHRIFPRRQAGIRRFLNKLSLKQCHDCLVQAADIDGILKGAQPGNGWNALELLCLRLI